MCIKYFTEIHTKCVLLHSLRYLKVKVEVVLLQNYSSQTSNRLIIIIISQFMALDMITFLKL